MFGLLATLVAVLVGAAVLGLVWAVIALVFWLLVLPFKLLGLAFRALAFVFVLPFLLVAGIFGAGVFGIGALLFAVPALPLLLLAFGIWWLVRRRATPHAA